MESTIQVLLIVFGILCGLFVCLCIGILGHKLYKWVCRVKLNRAIRDYLRTEGKIVKELEQFNKTYNFTTIKLQLGRCVDLNTLAQYKRFKANSELVKDVKLDIEYYKAVLARIKERRKDYKLYSKKFDELILAADYGGDSFEYKGESVEIESDYAHKCLDSYLIKLKKTDGVIINIRYIWMYTSPQGRNHYQQERIFTERDVERELDKLTEKTTLNKKDFAKEQRSMMTPKLRYSILKRDNFRCVLCGRTAEQTRQLEVDHIIPMSKGGLTIESNLRTLCFDCNRGKSDTYTEDELN